MTATQNPSPHSGQPEQPDEIEPATGVKGAQVVNLAKDLARSLSLVSIRVVETIPGKNYMALELPNAKRQTIHLSEILGSQVYHEAKSLLTVGLGKDIIGNPVVADLAKMPHVLVSYSTNTFFIFLSSVDNFCSAKIGRASCRERV